MTCVALTHWASTLNSHLRKPTWLLLVKDYRTGVFASLVSVLISSLPHPCFPSSRSLCSRPKKEQRARDTLLLPSRVSLSRARSSLRPLLPSACYAGYSPREGLLLYISHMGTLLHEIFATCLFRHFDERTFRDTLISRICENFIFWITLISRFWVQQFTFHTQCYLTCLSIK